LSVRFADPVWLAAFTALPVWWWFEHRRAKPSFVYSDVSLLLAPTAKSWRLRTAWLPTVVWLLGVSAVIIALARPQVSDATVDPRFRGRGVSLVVDVSGSMGKTMNIAGGVRTTRLDKAKEIIEGLLGNAEEAHSQDEFGLTVFAAQPKTFSPATTEQAFVRRKLAEAAIDARDNRTEIGAGIALGLDLVRDRKIDEAALVLFTDGAQRVEGGLGPLAGARIAEALGVPIIVVHFADDPEEAEDRKTLARVAEIAKGELIHWSDATAEKILAALPPPPRANAPLVVWRDVFKEWIAAAIVLLIAGALLRATVYRIAPVEGG
jgi:Ca-activated chloride channel family protein